MKYVPAVHRGDAVLPGFVPVERTIPPIPVALQVLTLRVTHFVSCPLYALWIRARRLNRLTGLPAEPWWTPAAELVGLIWHAGATVLTHATVCEHLTVCSSKTHWAVALRAAFYLHTLSAIQTAQTGT